MSRRKKITRQQVVDAIASIAFDDIGRYLTFSTDGEGKTAVRIRDSGDIDTRNIQEIAVSRDGRLTFKLYSRERALYRLVELVEPDDRGAKSGLLEALRRSLPEEEEDWEEEDV